MTLEMEVIMKIYAHRGNSSGYPENTMISFRSAVELGADGIETDIHLTKDGVLVITHDEEISRVSDGTGMVKNLTYDELLKFDFGLWKDEKFKGEKIPKLTDLLDLLEGTDMMLNIEIKMGFVLYPGIEEKVLETIRTRNFLDRVIFSSFNHYSLAKLKSLEPTAVVAPLYEEGIFEPYNYARTFGADYIHPHYKSVEQSIIEECHKKGISVNLWTVNHKDVAVHLESIGVDGIITDDPEMIINSIRR